MSEWLPLFPLSQPLFPGMKLDLQIFEQRYIKLVKSSLREDTSFGICAIKGSRENEGRETGVPESIFPIGVEVSIIDWRQMPNGLLGITVQGARRFKFDKTTVDPDALVRAEVDFLEAEPDEEIPEDFSGLVSIYDELRKHPEISKRLPDLQEVKASGLGNGLAQVLPMDLDSRIQCLEMSDALSRLDYLIEHIEILARN